MRGAFVLPLFLFISCTSPAVGQVVKPELSEVQRLQVQLALEKRKSAQAELQRAQQELVQRHQEAVALLNSLNRPGWVLNIDTLQYEPEPKAGEKK